MIWRSKNRAAPPPSAFICGCGHSGTSILAAILAAHPEVYVPPRETGAFLDSENTKVSSNYRSVVEEQIASGRRFLIEKTPRHIRHLDLIREIVPGAKFILPVRDGRDVATSMEKRFGDLSAAQERWILDNSIVSQEINSADCFIYRYEDFVEHPSATVQQICEFVGVSFFPELLDYHQTQRLWFGQSNVEYRDPRGPGHEAHRNWQINQPLFDGRGKWKRIHAEKDFDLLNTGAGLLLMQQFRYGETSASETELSIEIFDRPQRSTRSWRNGTGSWSFDDFLAEEHHRQYGRPWSVGRGYVNYLIAQDVRPEHKVLDFGCGAGRVGIFLIPYLEAGNYFGVDNHLGSLEAFARYESLLHQLAKHHPRIALSEQMQFAKFGVTFDVVLDFHVSHHMRDPLSFYDAASKVLAESGRIFVPHEPVPSLSQLAALGLMVAHKEERATFPMMRRGLAPSPEGKQWSTLFDHWHILQKR
jgi:SAM-dependent methyltransferase